MKKKTKKKAPESVSLITEWSRNCIHTCVSLFQLLKSVLLNLYFQSAQTNHKIKLYIHTNNENLLEVKLFLKTTRTKATDCFPFLYTYLFVPPLTDLLSRRFDVTTHARNTKQLQSPRKSVWTKPQTCCKYSKSLQSNFHVQNKHQFLTPFKKTGLIFT